MIDWTSLCKVSLGGEINQATLSSVILQVPGAHLSPCTTCTNCANKKLNCTFSNSPSHPKNSVQGFYLRCLQMQYFIKEKVFYLWGLLYFKKWHTWKNRPIPVSVLKLTLLLFCWKRWSRHCTWQKLLHLLQCIIYTVNSCKRTPLGIVH